jgi:hypothetical protein
MQSINTSNTSKGETKMAKFEALTVAYHQDIHKNSSDCKRFANRIFRTITQKLQDQSPNHKVAITFACSAQQSQVIIAGQSVNFKGCTTLNQNELGGANQAAILQALLKKLKHLRWAEQVNFIPLAIYSHQFNPGRASHHLAPASQDQRTQSLDYLSQCNIQDNMHVFVWMKKPNEIDFGHHQQLSQLNLQETTNQYTDALNKKLRANPHAQSPRPRPNSVKRDRCILL